MSTLGKLDGANVADLSTALGADVSTLAKILGVDLAAAPSMYLGGGFTTCRGETRRYGACVAAAVDASAPTLRQWHPDCQTTVWALVLSGADMYLGGDFTTVQGTARNRAACVASDVNASAPTLRAWNPNCNAVVLAMILSGADMYLGGYFTTVRGTARNRAACVASDVNSVAPTLRAWNPNCNGPVEVMLRNTGGGFMYMGGSFTTVRGSTRNRAALVDANVGAGTPTLYAWNPNCGATVRAMILSGSDMYLGGDFTTVRATGRSYAACVDATHSVANPTLRTWHPACNGAVYAMRLAGADLYLGGLFTTALSNGRNRVACVASDVSVSTLRAWNPDCGSPGVYALALTP